MQITFIDIKIGDFTVDYRFYPEKEITIYDEDNKIIFIGSRERLLEQQKLFEIVANIDLSAELAELGVK